ncbi:MAG: hypothetical protein LAT67_10015, partial [Balneolales bacterium]|nr:hypothetical protein [Balneolales bacterium]
FDQASNTNKIEAFSKPSITLFGTAMFHNLFHPAPTIRETSGECFGRVWRRVTQLVHLYQAIISWRYTA